MNSPEKARTHQKVSQRRGAAVDKATVRSLVALLLTLISAVARAELVRYELRYSTESPSDAIVRIRFEYPKAGPAVLVIPRNYPGGYAQIPYDAYVRNMEARSPSGQSLTVSRDEDGPRWNIGRAGSTLAEIEYRIDIGAMERSTHDAVASSKTRPHYAGFLGHSVFAYLEGMESEPVELLVEGPPSWPLLCTLEPRLPARSGSLVARSSDYYALADSQVLMGPDLTVERVDGLIPLYVAIYAEAPVDRQLEARLAREALDRVQHYFGDRPIAQYTVQLELLSPLPDHAYGFSQEHIDSGTFSLEAATALKPDSSVSLQDRVRFNFAHHMAHSWIPKRAYGHGYRPFNWEMTPVIDTIWFNEGFGRYAAIEATAGGMPEKDGLAYRESQLASLRSIIDSAPSFLRRLSLTELSQEASFLYSADFRTGRNVFARGALMAAEMDDRIRTRSHGAHSLRDGLRALLQWCDEHQRAFETGDLPEIFFAATGVQVDDILAHWLRPLETP